MTKYLLDTQVLIWWLEASQKLPKDFKNIIEEDSVKAVSVASIWEIVIKTRSGKLKLRKSLASLLNNLEFDILNINLNHVLGLNKLPLIHKDPFDRILVAQSIEEGYILLTTDKIVKKYFVQKTRKR